MNKDIIVLVHGFLGWGEDKLGDFRHWGFATMHDTLTVS